MWPFSKKEVNFVRMPLGHYEFMVRKAEEYADLYHTACREIADLKASNERLADALAAAKERAGDTW